MANAFDQFDEAAPTTPTANPFDKFDAAAGVPEPAATFAERFGQMQPPARSSAIDQIKAAVTDVPTEIYGAGKAAIDRLASMVSLSRRAEQMRALANAPLSERLGLLAGQYGEAGRDIAAIPAVPTAPITGAARSLIGHPYSAVTGIPYEQAKEAVDLATMAIRPRGAAPVRAPGPPSVAELKGAYRTAIENPTVAGVEIGPQSVAALGQKIEGDLVTKGRFRPISAPQTFEILKELTPGEGVSSVSVADLDSTHGALGVIARQRDAVGQPTPDAVAAMQAGRAIDEYLANLPAGDVLAGNPQAAASILSEARKNWGAAKRSEDIGVRLTRAERQAARSGTGSNIENSLRQKISAILDSPARAAMYSPEQRASMEQFVRGTVPRNLLRDVGKLGVEGGLSLLLHTGSAYATGGATVPIAIGGTIARKLGEGLTWRAARKLDEAIRADSPLGKRLNQSLGDWGQAAEAFKASPSSKTYQGVVTASYGLAGVARDAGVDDWSPGQLVGVAMERPQ